MKYIDLSIKHLDATEGETTPSALEGALSKHRLIVLLGSPGSGKTSLLKKYHENNPHASDLLSIKTLLKLKRKPKPKAEIILLDGLDEYRSTSSDKSFVMTELGDWISKFAKTATVVISCREMDWYGETDVSALKDEVNLDAALYAIQPLDVKQQKEMADVLDVKNPDVFISKFSTFGFLGNPQMFTMLSEIYKNDPNGSISTKTGLYETFVKNAREKNPKHKQNNILEPADILKYAGYLAFFFLFTEVEDFNSEVIDNICDTEAGYPYGKLEATLNTNLFSEGVFIHRTIAEFVLASFIKDQMLPNRQLVGISISRIKNLFVKNDRIPTELRGTYAWLCSMTRNKNLIAIDPYYQAIHGDNSLFDWELKKEVILQVKAYAANTNPYFFRSHGNLSLEGFYELKLDTFLALELTASLKLNNHYAYFINTLIAEGKNLSTAMKASVKKAILTSKRPAYYKRELLDVFKNNPKFLITVLNRVENKIIPDDEGDLLDDLLRQLYPTDITPIKVVKYLSLYNKYVGGYCHYLYRTEYKDKYKLIDEIYRNSLGKQKTPPVKLPENVEGFVSDYFLETLLKYEEGLSAEDIFKLISHFRSYYSEYDKIKFKSYRYTITDRLEACEEKLQRLTNELFERFVDDLLKAKIGLFDLYRFDYFFNYKIPNNRHDVLLKKIHSNRDSEVNTRLFTAALSNYPKGKANCKTVRAIAKQYGLQKDLHDFLNPPKQAWEIENEKRRKKEEQEKREVLDKNEEYFRKRTDAQIMRSFNELIFIGDAIYFDREGEDDRVYLKSVTKKRLTKLLENAIHAKNLISPKLLTLASLVKNSPDARRNLDRMYYTSCCLNNWNKIKFKEGAFYEYLYINTLMNGRMGGIKKTNLLEKVDAKNSTRSKEILFKYTKLLIKESFPKRNAVLLPYFKSADIKVLQSFLDFFVSDGATLQDALVYNFLNAFSFKIAIKDLKALNGIGKKEKNKHTLQGLIAVAEDRKSKFNVNMAIAMHSLISRETNRKAFSNCKSALRIRLIDYMLSQFQTAASIQHVSGLQSPKNSCARFLSEEAFGILNLGELIDLYDIRKGTIDVWSDRIIHKIDEQRQADVDKDHCSRKVVKIKNFILANEIVSASDFHLDVLQKLDQLRIEIEDNEGNLKDLFYNEVGTSKNEESCRDVIFNLLSSKYGYNFLLTREKLAANNRVDIHVLYKGKDNFGVQIECKKDKNADIYTGISNQLIKKYLSTQVEYGIYLIFYFGDKKNKKGLLQRVNTDIPEAYADKVKVVCVDFVGK